MSVPPPQIDRELGDGVPADAALQSITPRAWSDLVADCMTMWDCSKPAAERRAEPYSDRQLEWLLRQYWTSSA